MMISSVVIGSSVVAGDTDAGALGELPPVDGAGVVVVGFAVGAGVSTGLSSVSDSAAATDADVRGERLSPPSLSAV